MQELMYVKTLSSTINEVQLENVQFTNNIALSIIQCLNNWLNIAFCSFEHNKLYDKLFKTG